MVYRHIIFSRGFLKFIAHRIIGIGYYSFNGITVVSSSYSDSLGQVQVIVSNAISACCAYVFIMVFHHITVGIIRVILVVSTTSIIEVAKFIIGSDGIRYFQQPVAAFLVYIVQVINLYTTTHL